MKVGAAAFVLLVAGAGCAAGRVPDVSTATPPMPRPGPRARADAANANAACEGCHPGAAATWRGSLHARSWTEPIFQRSFAEEPSAFCRDCHAPETAAPALGVACVTCHDPGATGVVLAAEGAPVTRGPAPHRVVRDPGFAGDGACAGCHEFAFPDAGQRAGAVALMQRTATEHLASRFADRTCASCHMPKLARGGRGHAFAVASDPSMLRRALVARVTRNGDGRVSFELTPGEVGHAFPTGDLFRRVVVVAEVIGDDYQLVVHAERALARHFHTERAVAGAAMQRERADDRIQGPRPTRVELELGPLARGREIAWRVEWQRVQSMHDAEAVIADTVVVAEGRLSPAQRGLVP